MTSAISTALVAVLDAAGILTRVVVSRTFFVTSVREVFPDLRTARPVGNVCEMSVVFVGGHFGYIF